MPGPPGEEKRNFLDQGLFLFWKREKKKTLKKERRKKKTLEGKPVPTNLGVAKAPPMLKSDTGKGFVKGTRRRIWPNRLHFKFKKKEGKRGR